MTVIAQRDSATGWYKKGDKAEFVRELNTPQIGLIEVRKSGDKKTTIVVASNWGWL